MKKAIATLMILVISVSPLFRGLYFELEAYAFLAVLALLSVVYLFTKLANREAMRFHKWILVFGVCLIAAYILSFAKAVSIRDNITSLIQISTYLLVSIILYDYYHEKKRLFGQTLMLFTVIAGFINAILGIEALSGAFESLNYTLIYMRVGGMFQYANTAAVYFMICVVFSIALIHSVKSILLKLMLSGMGNIAFLALLLTSSRGGFLVGIAVFLLMWALQPKGYRLKYVCSFVCTVVPAFLFIGRIITLGGSRDYISIAKWMAVSFMAAVILSLIYGVVSSLLSGAKASIRNGLAVVCLVGFLAVAAVIVLNHGITAILPGNIIMRFQTLGLQDRNIILRLTYFRDALKLISSNWLLGLGGGGWYSLYQSVQDMFYVARTVHNHYLQVFVEAGILGFISFLAIILLSLINMFYSLINQKDDTERIMLTGIFCGFLALVLHSSFDFNLSYVSMALLLWTFVAGSAVCLSEKSTANAGTVLQTISFRSNAAKLAVIVACSALFSVSGLFTASAYYADRGFNSLLRKDYVTSGTYYLKASHLDPLNPVYHFQLAKVYYNYSKRSADPIQVEGWRRTAIKEAEQSVLLNPCYPEYREILAFICYESDQPLKALENAEKLIELQPLKNSNYELLAKCYLKSAEYYRNNNNMDKCREMLIRCSQVDQLPKVTADETIMEYKHQALALLKSF